MYPFSLVCLTIYISICVIFISVYKSVYLFYYLSYNLILSLFCCQNCSSFDRWEHFQIGFFWHAPSIFIFIFSTSFFSGITWCFRLIFHISCPSPRISYSSKEPWFLLRMVLQNQDLCAWCANCCWGVTVPTSSQWTEQ